MRIKFRNYEKRPTKRPPFSTGSDIQKPYIYDAPSLFQIRDSKFHDNRCGRNRERERDRHTEETPNAHLTSLDQIKINLIFNLDYKSCQETQKMPFIKLRLKLLIKFKYVREDWGCSMKKVDVVARSLKNYAERRARRSATTFYHARTVVPTSVVKRFRTSPQSTRWV